MHNELPDCKIPYKHYGSEIIEDVADGVVGPDDIETENYPCEGTMKHWKWGISPGWLSVVARYIYNSRGRIEPYPER